MALLPHPHLCDTMEHMTFIYIITQQHTVIMITLYNFMCFEEVKKRKGSKFSFTEFVRLTFDFTMSDPTHFFLFQF